MISSSLILVLLNFVGKIRGFFWYLLLKNPLFKRLIYLFLSRLAFFGNLKQRNVLLAVNLLLIQTAASITLKIWNQFLTTRYIWNVFILVRARTAAYIKRKHITLLHNWVILILNIHVERLVWIRGHLNGLQLIVFAKRAFILLPFLSLINAFILNYLHVFIWVNGWLRLSKWADFVSDMLHFLFFVFFIFKTVRILRLIFFIFLGLIR